MTKPIRRAAIATGSILALSGLLLLLGPARLAAASCAPPLGVTEAIAQSDVVVVGTVTATRSHARLATVAVDEVWKGKIEHTFEVAGGPAADNMATSVDRAYTVGARYLLFAREPRAHDSVGTFGARYEDNSCSATQTWNESLTAFRPATATITRQGDPPPASIPPIRTHGTTNDTGPWLLLIATTAVSFAVAGLVVTWLRRHRAPAATWS